MTAVTTLIAAIRVIKRIVINTDKDDDDDSSSPSDNAEISASGDFVVTSVSSTVEVVFSLYQLVFIAM